MKTTPAWILFAALAVSAASAPSEKADKGLEDGEMTEVLAAPSKPLEPEAPPPRVQRLSLRLLPGHPVEDGLFAEVQYERLAEPRKSWTAAAGYRFLSAGGDVLEYEFRGGPRWYFARGHEGPYVNLQGLIAFNGGDTPVLAGVPVSMGYLRPFHDGNWVVGGELGFGVGYYWYPSPKATPSGGALTKYETAGVIGFLELGASVGYRF